MQTKIVINVVIASAGYPSKAQQKKKKKNLFKFSSFFLLGQSHLQVFMILSFYRLCR